MRLPKWQKLSPISKRNLLNGFEPTVPIETRDDRRTRKEID
jgi:hypothetical protein